MKMSHRNANMNIGGKTIAAHRFVSIAAITRALQGVIAAGIWPQENALKTM
jgi:hypothetical protein